MAKLIIISILFLILVIGMIFAATSYKRLLKVYNRYSGEFVTRGITGYALAEFAIRKFRLKTKIYLTDKMLGDMYFPRKDIVLLSEKSANTSSVSALSVTAHEISHAVQYKNKSKYIIISNIVGVLCFISNFILVPMLISGIVLLFFPQYFDLGFVFIIISFCLPIFSFILKVVTIPVEFNASKIAYNFMKQYHILTADELVHAKKVLNAAGRTYIASLFQGPLNMLKEIGRSFRR